LGVKIRVKWLRTVLGRVWDTGGTRRTGCALSKKSSATWTDTRQGRIYRGRRLTSLRIHTEDGLGKVTYGHNGCSTPSSISGEINAGERTLDIGELQPRDIVGIGSAQRSRLRSEDERRATVPGRGELREDIGARSILDEVVVGNKEGGAIQALLNALQVYSSGI
jgi:hypothetical protein